MDYLFVYGTLLQNAWTEMSVFLQKQSIVLAEGWFPGYLYRIDWYPGAIYDEKSDYKVFGTIVQLNDTAKVLRVLDEYEELGDRFPQPHEYRREIVSVNSENGTVFSCWTYLYNRPVDPYPLIETGRFI